MDALAKQQDRSNDICAVPDCGKLTAGNEKLCVIHYYQLPRATRAALAIQDELTRERYRRLVIMINGGQPLDQIYNLIREGFDGQRSAGAQA